MRRIISDTPARLELITVRVTLAEKTALTERARHLKITVAELVRSAGQMAA